MVSEKVTVHLSGSLENRPIAMIVQLASQFRSEIHLESDNRSINAKSIMGMMTMGIDSGDELTVVANGQDEEEALKQMVAFLSQNS
ncbi:MAG TPA: HPr family phosphocarrier protein [Lachnospiraceae bacterium]|nr:HPr family phosphocarrier protein [Lachnospiraceae bacterium]